MLSDLPSRVLRSPGRYAVLLNARAKRWTGQLHQDVQRWVTSQDLFLTDDFHQAERTVEKLLAADYDVIFTGGGDGTIVYLLNAIEQRIRDGKLARDDAPPVGVLRMGTGNAIATYMGSRDIVDDLRALRAGSPLIVYEMGMLESQEGMFPFAGFGWDALILNDYDNFKESVAQTAWENYATGLGGYVVSVATRSIPAAVKGRGNTMRVTNLGSAVRIDQDGTVLEEYQADDVIYEGRVTVASAATEPYWGFKIRMFPHCTERDGHFEFRAFSGSVVSVLRNLPGFWRGEFDRDEIDSFLCTNIRVEILDGAMPYHVAGDPAGYERVVEWKYAPHPAHLAVPLR